MFYKDQVKTIGGSLYHASLASNKNVVLTHFLRLVYSPVPLPLLSVCRRQSDAYCATPLSFDSLSQQIRANRDMVLLDSRSPIEFEKCHLAGSMHVPLFAVKTMPFLKSMPLVLIGEGHSYKHLQNEAAIPARGMSGYVCRENGILEPEAYHNWAEFYDGGVWKIADPQRRVFAQEASQYVAMRIIGSSSNNPMGTFHRYRCSIDQVEVTMTSQSNHQGT